MYTEGLGIGVIVSVMMSWAFVFGLEIIEDQLLVIKNIRVGEFYYATKAAIYLRGNPIKNPHM